MQVEISVLNWVLYLFMSPWPSLICNISIVFPFLKKIDTYEESKTIPLLTFLKIAPFSFCVCLYFFGIKGFNSFVECCLVVSWEYHFWNTPYLYVLYWVMLVSFTGVMVNVIHQFSLGTVFNYSNTTLGVTLRYSVDVINVHNQLTLNKEDCSR